MNHVHRWFIYGQHGEARCQVRGCLIKERAFRDYQAPPYLAYTWNAAGFNHSGHLPLPRMRDDEGYD